MRLKSFDKNRKLKLLRRKYNRENKITTRTIVLSVFILIFSIFYFTYAVFNSSKEFTLVDATVGDFSGDIKVISYNYDDGGGTISKHSVPPKQSDGYAIKSVDCENATGSWAHDSWSLKIKNISGMVSCELTFDKQYIDNAITSVPELYDGLIPVTIDESDENKGTIKVADTSSEWYDYGKHKWANAVIPIESARNKKPGDVLLQDEILQMYVWVPRYRYKLWNAQNESSNEQMIEIEFEDANTTKSTGSLNGEWLTHPAFTFGSTELPGFWVGKFETGYAGANGESDAQNNKTDSSKIIIKPNSYSWRNINVSNMFYTSLKINNNEMFQINALQVDTHLIKNMEWGAVAYLSHSKYGRYINDNTCIDFGCEVWLNPHEDYVTGYSGGDVDSDSTYYDDEKDEEVVLKYPWNDNRYGGSSSTTGNLYGVYDMSGCSEEYVMGNVEMSFEYSWNAGKSKFQVAPEQKYYDAYINNSSLDTAHENGKLGDATKETLKVFADVDGGWGEDGSYFPESECTWFVRGGANHDWNRAGIFSFSYSDGDKNSYYSWRVVITAH